MTPRDIRSNPTPIGCGVSVLAAMLVPAILAAGCGQRSAIQPSGNTVKIGVIAPLSGEDEEIGRSGLQGVEMALQHHPLLDNGDRLELVVVDDQSRSNQVAAALGQLAGKGAVAALILSRSDIARALKTRAEETALPLLATIASHPALTEENPNLVQLSFDDALQARVAAMFLRDELLLDRVAVFTDNRDTHFQILAEEFAAQFVEANGVVVEQWDLSKPTPDLADRLAGLRENNVDVLYVPASAAMVLEVMTGLDEIGWRPTVMSSDGLLSEILLKHEDQLELVSGLMATDICGSLTNPTAFGADMLDRYRNQDQRYGSTYTVLATEGTSILIKALNRCAPPYQPWDVQRRLRRIDQFEGFDETIAIGPNGKAVRPVYVNTLRNRTLEVVVKVY